MPAEDIFGMMFLTGMVVGVVVIVMAIRQRSQVLEMQHRERMAMIERGMTPGSPSVSGRGVLRDRSVASMRFMTLGIIVMAIGLALMTIISIAAGSPDVGVGIGGAIMIVGAAFIVNSLVTRSMTTMIRDVPLPPPPFPPIDRVE